MLPKTISASYPWVSHFLCVWGRDSRTWSLDATQTGPQPPCCRVNCNRDSNVLLSADPVQVPPVLHTASRSVLNQLVSGALAVLSPRISFPKLQYHKLGGGLKQQLFILSQFWKLKVWNQGVGRAMLPSKPSWQNPSWPLPLPDGSDVFLRLHHSGAHVCLHVAFLSVGVSPCAFPSSFFFFCYVARVMLVALPGI